jgi:hypothetical protein
MTRGGSPAWRLDVGLTTPHHKKEACNETTKPWAWTDSLDKRPKQRNMEDGPFRDRIECCGLDWFDSG